MAQRKSGTDKSGTGKSGAVKSGKAVKSAKSKQSAKVSAAAKPLRVVDSGIKPSAPKSYASIAVKENKGSNWELEVHAGLDFLIAPHREDIEARIRHRSIEREEAVLDVELAPERGIGGTGCHAHVADRAQRHVRRTRRRDGAREAEIRARALETEALAEIDVDVRARRERPDRLSGRRR